MQDTLIDGRYHIERVIGGGATSAVYQARDQRTGAAVAVKVLHASYAGDDVATERFRREARTAAAITSPRVVRIQDQGTHEGTPYIVMELIQGETLAAALRRQGALPLPEALGIALEIARATDAAFAAGVIHRDLKPQNIILTDGQVKVFDFGIARTRDSITLTSTGHYMGTPAYSAPERLSSVGDIRVDIYATGVILYELLAGALPFIAETPQALLQRHATDDPPPLPPETPPAMARIVHRCLLKDPDQRYATPHELILALEDAQRRLGVSPVIPWPAPPAPPQAASAPDDTLVIGPAAVPSNIPPRAGRFIGRVAERRALHRRLGEVRLLTITGAAGAGKTRLALELAEEAGPAYPDGVWLVELAPLADQELVAQSVASALGLELEPDQPVADALVAHLASRRVLLVLDNCEHLGDAPGHLAARLVASCAGVRLLATSRELLGIPGEGSWRIASLETPAARELSDAEAAAHLTASDATALFLERSGLHPSAKDAAAIITICGRLSGVALAIELVALRAREQPVSAVAAELGERVRALTGRTDGVIPRDRVLDTVLDWCYDALPLAQQVLLRRLSVFAGGTVVEAAAAVCAEEVEAAAQVATRLRALAELGLVQELPPEAATPGEPRFRLLEPVRQFAGRRLLSAGEAAATQHRHRDWYLDFSDQLNNGLFRDQQALWLARGEREHDNLRAAITWCADDPAEAEAEMTLCANVRPFWSYRGFQEEGRRRLSAAAGHGDGSASVARARAWIGLGMLAMDQGDFDEAEHALAAGVAAARATGEAWWIGIALMQQANVYATKGDFATAKPLWEESLTFAQAAGNRQSAANLAANLAIIEAKAGNFSRARQLTEASRAIIAESGDKIRLANVETNLANIDSTLGLYDSARARYESVVATHSGLGDSINSGSAIEDLGGLEHMLRDFAGARDRYDEALAVYRRLGEQRGIASALQRLGALALDMGDLTEARRRLNEARELAAAIDAREPLAAIGLNLGRLALVEHQPLEAAKELHESLTLNQATGDLLGVIACLDAFAAVAVAKGRAGRAATLLAATAALRERHGIILAPNDRPGRAATVDAVRAALTAEVLEQAERAGGAMDLESAATYARE